MILLSQFYQPHKDSTESHRIHITITEHDAVEDLKQWNPVLYTNTNALIRGKKSTFLDLKKKLRANDTGYHVLSSIR